MAARRGAITPSQWSEHEEQEWWDNYWRGNAQRAATTRISPRFSDDDRYWGRSQERVLKDIEAAITSTKTENA